MDLKLYTGESRLTREGNLSLNLFPYITPPSLAEAVKLAQILQRPLLVKGEPGCGKSKLAEAVAAELHGEFFRDYYFEWNIKSSSKAIDGLYTINNLQRLSDANIKNDEKKNLDIKLNLVAEGTFEISGKYIELGKLGQAFVQTNKYGLSAPPVILIDEIDKADIDFPNDLLLELDRMEFPIPEATDQDGNPVVIKAYQKCRPIVIITSNDEKPLPAAFLRRCLFHYIDFSEIDLPSILKSRYPGLDTEIREKALDKFKLWRTKIEESGTGNKNVSTSELLDWVKAIDFFFNKENNQKIEEDGKPAYHQALLKDVESIKVFVKKENVSLKP